MPESLKIVTTPDNATTTNRIEDILQLIATTDQTLVIHPKCKGGLIIDNDFYCDLICPGSSLTIPRNFGCKAVYFIGNVQFCVVPAGKGSQQALQNRISTIKSLQRLLATPNDHRKTCLLINFLCRQFGLKAVRHSSPDLLGRLISVQSQQIIQAIELYEANLLTLAREKRLGDQSHLAWQSKIVTLPEPLETMLTSVSYS